MSDSASAIWSIARLTRQIKQLIEGGIGEVWVTGEISNWKVASSGHAYFTLKDEESQVDAVMFKGSLNRLKFEPESGLEVLAFGRVTVYERRGNYQIVLSDMQPKGVGALQLAFEKVKKKLAAEGIFDEAHKKPLPMLPRKIGVVTSPTGAAIRDILNVLSRRFAQAHVVIYPARVQGAEAAAELVAGIRALDAWGVDVMIVGRGGGSLEDLWPFNEEAVVRAVFAARTPIISAVGHEIDYALTDFAADVRAPTPSAAAEMVVKEHEALLERVNGLRDRMAVSLGRHVERMQNRCNQLGKSWLFQRPEELLREHRQTVDELRMRLEGAVDRQMDGYGRRVEKAGRALQFLSPVQRLIQSGERLCGLEARMQRGVRESVREARHRQLRAAAALRLVSPAPRVRQARERLLAVGGAMERAMRRGVESRRSQWAPLGAKLNALSPLAILSRGYAIAWKLPEAHIVNSVEELAPGMPLRIRFGKGSVRAQVTEIEEGS